MSSHKSIKAAKRPTALTKRSEWAAWMHGADPEWLASDKAQELARAFPQGLPQWLVKSRPWRPVTGKAFAMIRKHVLRLDVRQCAAYFEVSQAQVRRWESGEDALPIAAFEALRLQTETEFARLSHKVWDGWYIDEKSAELVSPDRGRLSLTPGDLNGVPGMLAERSILRALAADQERRLGELEAENAALRAGQKVRQVADELAEMHARIGDLLGELQTADVLPFPVANHQPVMRKVAS
jgi:DNA-binding transcriptional regulator YiaG